MVGAKAFSHFPQRSRALRKTYTEAVFLSTGENLTTSQEFVCPYVLCFPAILLSRGSALVQEADVQGDRSLCYCPEEATDEVMYWVFLGFRRIVKTKPALRFCGVRADTDHYLVFLHSVFLIQCFQWFFEIGLVFTFRIYHECHLWTLSRHKAWPSMSAVWKLWTSSTDFFLSHDYLFLRCSYVGKN